MLVSLQLFSASIVSNILSAIHVDNPSTNNQLIYFKNIIKTLSIDNRKI